MKKITIEINVPDDFSHHNLSRVVNAAECEASEDFLIQIWNIEDVQSAVDYDLSDEQAREVLYRVDRYHDANIGINWDVIQYHADEVHDADEVEEQD